MKSNGVSHTDYEADPGLWDGDYKVLKATVIERVNGETKEYHVETGNYSLHVDFVGRWDLRASGDKVKNGLPSRAD